MNETELVPSMVWWGKKTTFIVELFPLVADLLARVLSSAPFSISQWRFNCSVSLETQELIKVGAIVKCWTLFSAGLSQSPTFFSFCHVLQQLRFSVAVWIPKVTPSTGSVTRSWKMEGLIWPIMCVSNAQKCSFSAGGARSEPGSPKQCSAVSSIKWWKKNKVGAFRPYLACAHTRSYFRYASGASMLLIQDLHTRSCTDGHTLLASDSPSILAWLLSECPSVQHTHQ